MAQVFKPIISSPGVTNLSVSAKTVAYTTLSTDNVVTFDMSGTSNASYAVTLLTASGNAGLVQTFVVTKGTGILSVNTTSAQTVGGLASGTIKMATVNDSITVVSDGANWQILEWNITVGCRYVSSSTTISGGFAVVVWTTKSWDPLSLMSSGSFTANVPGKYTISSGLFVTGTIVLNSNTLLGIFINGSEVSTDSQFSGGAETNMDVGIVDTVILAAGDVVTIQTATNITGPTIAASSTKNFVSIIRTGN